MAKKALRSPNPLQNPHLPGNAYWSPNKRVQGPGRVLVQSRQRGQRSAPGGDLNNYLYRIIPAWMNPQWTDPVLWRNFVLSIPAATLCRETLIENILALDWKIVPRDSEKYDELKPEIQYYTKLLEKTTGYYSDFDFTSHVEWIGKDLLDLPFGCASEIGREGDKPNGKVMWIRPLDAGTLMPTLNFDFPVIQRVPNLPVAPVAFPRHAISRSFISPRTDIWREGWGMAPPEKIYLSLELLRRGDKYYAELLLNTPETGILDLMDMEKETAEEWIGSFRDMMAGVDPFKIPVLYEHTQDVKWIPFGKLPNDIMYSDMYMRFITFCTAGYGMTPSDLGFGSSANGGETMSGTIRNERKTRRTGYAMMKKKLKAYFDQILPEYLMFLWVDYDEENQIAIGRSRLSNAQGFKLFIDERVLSPDEARLQLINDGLMTISIPEKLDRSKVEWPPVSSGKAGFGTTSDPKAASSGGFGEIKDETNTIQKSSASPDRAILEKIVLKAYPVVKVITDTMTGDLRQWSHMIDDAIYFGSQNDVLKNSLDRAVNLVQAAIVKKNLIQFTYDPADMDALVEILRGKIIDERTRQLEEAYVLNQRSDYEIGVSDLDKIDEYLHSVNIAEIADSASQHSANVLLNLLSMKSISLLKDALLEKSDIDKQASDDDNKIKAARKVAMRLADEYPQMIAAASNAGKDTIEYLMDKESQNYGTACVQ